MKYTISQAIARRRPKSVLWLAAISCCQWKNRIYKVVGFVK